MKVVTKCFGTVEIGDEKIITFEKGLIGFDDYKKYTILYDIDKGEDCGISWLQSVDEPSLALPIMQPEIVKEEYNPVVDDELVYSLGEDVKAEQLLVVVTVTVPTDLTKMTCNLKAPIIINTETRKGIQAIADNDDYLVKFPIYDILNAGSDGKEGK